MLVKGVTDGYAMNGVDCKAAIDTSRQTSRHFTDGIFDVIFHSYCCIIFQILLMFVSRNKLTRSQHWFE